VTEYDAAESFHIPCPLYGSKEWRCSVKPAPESPSVPGHATFWAAVGKQFGTCLQILSKTDAVWRHVTGYDAAESFHVFYMDQMSDDAQCQTSSWVPSCVLSQAMSLFVGSLEKSLTLCLQISSKTDALCRNVTKCDAAELFMYSDHTCSIEFSLRFVDNKLSFLQPHGVLEATDSLKPFLSDIRSI
jgi:hypothetical protein